MNFHMPAGELNDEAPEVWGCPRLSDHGAGWLLDWYSAVGNHEGVSVMRGVDVAFLSKAKVEAEQNEVSQWLYSLDKLIPF